VRAGVQFRSTGKFNTAGCILVVCVRCACVWYKCVSVRCYSCIQTRGFRKFNIGKFNTAAQRMGQLRSSSHRCGCVRMGTPRGRAVRLPPTVPPIQLPLNVLFIIFYYLSLKNSSPYNSSSPTILSISSPLNQLPSFFIHFNFSFEHNIYGLYAMRICINEQ